MLIRRAYFVTLIGLPPNDAGTSDAFVSSAAYALRRRETVGRACGHPHYGRHWWPALLYLFDIPFIR